MNRIKYSIVAFGGLSLLIGVVALLTPRPTLGQGGSTKPPSDVNVVNTPSVNVANAPTVNLASDSSVGISPLSNTVRLPNTPANPLPVFDANDARQPFQATASSAQDEGTNGSTVTVATVPAGKRLVIEFASMVGQVPPGQHVVGLRIITIAPPFGGATHDLLVHEQPAFVNGDALYRASQQVRLYANPGSTVGDVRAAFTRDSSAGEALFTVSISGYLVDLP